MDKFLYITNQEHGLVINGAHNMEVYAINQLLLDLLDTVSTTPGTKLEVDNARVIEDAWSNHGYELEVQGSDNVTMYLRKVRV